MPTNVTIEQIKSSFGHSGCDCRTCDFIDAKFDNINEIVRATERGLNELGVTSTKGEDYIVPAAKLFLQRNYRNQTVFEHTVNGVSLSK